MMAIEIFFEVFKDIRFPFLAVDLDKLCTWLDLTKDSAPRSHFALTIDAPSSKRAEFVSSMRGLLSNVDVPSSLVRLLSRAPQIRGTERAQLLIEFAKRRPSTFVGEQGDQLVWEEESLWPLAYSTLLGQLVNISQLHKALIEERAKETSERLMAKGYAPENASVLS
jgi:hypothetical protein